MFFFFSIVSFSLIFLRFYILTKHIKLSLFKRFSIVLHSIQFSQIPLPGLSEAYKFYNLKDFGKENILYLIIFEKINSLTSYFFLQTCTKIINLIHLN